MNKTLLLPESGPSPSRPVLFSIVINCFNGAEYLSEALESVFAQTYSNWEVIFWDNQSSDNSAAIFNSYCDHRLRYFLAPIHEKLGAARNSAVKNAQGDWVCFLDCDDVWLPQKLERQAAIIAREGEGLGLVYGQMLVLDSRHTRASHWSDRISKYKAKTLLKRLPEGDVFDQLLLIDFVPLLTAAVRASLYCGVGGVSDHFEMSEDYDLFLKVASISRVAAVQDIVGLYRIHQTNTSIFKAEKGFRENLEIISRYLPLQSAKRAQRFHHSCRALVRIKSGQLMAGFYDFISRGGMFDIPQLIRLKLLKRLD